MLRWAVDRVKAKGADKSGTALEAVAGGGQRPFGNVEAIDLGAAGCQCLQEIAGAASEIDDALRGGDEVAEMMDEAVADLFREIGVRLGLGDEVPEPRDALRGPIHKRVSRGQFRHEDSMAWDEAMAAGGAGTSALT